MGTYRVKIHRRRIEFPRNTNIPERRIYCKDFPDCPEIPNEKDCKTCFKWKKIKKRLEVKENDIRKEEKEELLEQKGIGIIKMKGASKPIKSEEEIVKDELETFMES
tara:strand:+ start:212 stop:532 length:321 start_codon:yes stop_codon:yes gene_type:complete